MILKQIFFNNQQTFDSWRNFLQSQGIDNFDQSEIKTIDYTVAVLDDNDRFLAVGSLAGKVIKYVAVKDKGGRQFNMVISDLMSKAAEKSIFHIFVFTKNDYIDTFRHVGFKKIVSTKQAAILESGDRSIEDFLHSIPLKKSKKRALKISSLVMNANPFTKGHYYLLKKAAERSDLVYLFIVSTDLSLFTFKERFALAKAACQDVKNVVLVAGDDYLVSTTTFPAYFLKSGADTAYYQADLDATLFKEKIAPYLGIKWRYLGQEPFSATTAIYNQVLKKRLEPEIKAVILPRLQNDQGEIIGASRVRSLIYQDDLSQLEKYLPKSSLNYILEHIDDIRQRMRREG